MKKLEEAVLNQIIENHYHWLHKDCEDWEYMRADLSKANMSIADLSRINLSRANMSIADLSRINLSMAKNIPYIPNCGADMLEPKKEET